MHGFGSDATSSAGQRSSDSPDYAPPDSPRQSLIVTLHLPPGLLRLFTQSGADESGDEAEESEEESSSDSSEDDFEGSSIEETYDNADKEFFYDSDNDSDVVGADEEDDEVVYESIEFDEDNSENVTAGQSLEEEDGQSDNARVASSTPLVNPDHRANSPTGKLLASCLDTNEPLFHDYLKQRKTLAVDFLERNNDVVELFLTRQPIFVEQFLRRNYQETLSLFADDPRWFIEGYLHKHSYLVEGYLADHPESVEGFINANPKYFDQYLIRHPEFAINYLHYNRLPSGYGIPPDMFGVTSIVTPPPSNVRTESPPSAGLPSPDTSPPAAPPPPPPADGPGRKSTTRKPQAIRKPPTKPASRSQQALPKAALAEPGRKPQQRPPASATASVSATLPSLVDAPMTPDSAPKKTAGPSRSKSRAASGAAAPSNGSSHTQIYNVLLTSAYGQTAGQFMGYPASTDLLAASRKQDAGTKGSWRLFEEDKAIKHMLDVRDEAQLAGESRFQEVSRRLTAEGIERGFFAVKNYWNRTGRARSGFDERKNKTAPLATSKQSKAFRQGKKGKGQSKNKRGKRVKTESEGEEDDNDEDSSGEYSVHSEEETTPPPSPPPPPPPPPPPLPAPAPAPAPQKSAMKRTADYDDAALAKAQSYGTRPKKQRTG
jgi:hypothetical protein